MKEINKVLLKIQKELPVINTTSSPSLLDIQCAVLPILHSNDCIITSNEVTNSSDTASYMSTVITHVSTGDYISTFVKLDDKVTYEEAIKRGFTSLLSLKISKGKSDSVTLVTSKK